MKQETNSKSIACCDDGVSVDGHNILTMKDMHDIFSGLTWALQYAISSTNSGAMFPRC